MFRRQTTYQKRPRIINTQESQLHDVSSCNGGVSLNTFVLTGMINDKAAITYNVTFRRVLATNVAVGKQ